MTQTFAELADGKPLNDALNQQWCVAKRPRGNVCPEDFGWRETDIPALQVGDVLLRTHYLSLAPVMRSYMSGASFANEAPLGIGDVVHGRGVAQIIKSRHPDWREGEVVQGQIGWQTHKISQMTPKEKFRRMPPNGLPASLGLGALGMTGLSAWAGLYKVGEPKPEDTVIVSGAAGGVGSLVIQMASRVTGCQVTGIAGSADKCELIQSLGCIQAINYRETYIAEEIKSAAPEGIDLYFDNVGGETLDACLDNLALRARIVLCGSISEYTRDEPYRLPAYTRLRKTDSQMRGFFVYNHLHEWDRAMDEMAGWLKDGSLRPVEQVTDGFEHMPGALAGLYDGTNFGKQLCRVRGEPENWI